MNGTFFAVSVGPGNEALITLQSMNMIKSCPVVFSPKTLKGSVAFDIAKKALGEDAFLDKDVFLVDVPMTSDMDKVNSSHKNIVSECVFFLKNGKDVAFLTLGDLSIYSSASQIASLIEKEGFKVVRGAGVTSISASSALVGKALVDGNEVLSVIPADSAFKDGSLNELIKRKGTKVLMKCGKSLHSILRVIKDLNLHSKSVLVVNCGMKGERVIKLDDGFSSDDIESSYFSMIIIKD